MNTDDMTDDEYEAMHERWEAGIDAFRLILGEMSRDRDSIRPSEYIEFARMAKTMLECVAHSGDSPEYMSECRVDGTTLGEFLLQNLGQCDGPIDKRKWFDVAEVLGPDWAQVLYHAAVFTTKVA